MNDVQTGSGGGVATRPEFRWKMANGTEIKPVDMKTSHLFNSVVMLWHHFMPAEATLYHHKRWTIRKTPAHVDEAIRVLMPEMAAREDLNEFQFNTMKRMAEFLRNNNGWMAVEGPPLMIGDEA